MPSVNRSPRAQRSSIADACSIAYRIETARSPHPTTTRSVRSRAPSAMAAPSRARAPIRSSARRRATGRGDRAPRGPPRRGPPARRSRAGCSQGPLQRHPEPAREQRNHHQTAADAQETGDEAGEGPDPSEDRSRRRSTRSFARLRRRIEIACQPSRTAVTIRSTLVSIAVVSQAPSTAPTTPGPTSHGPLGRRPRRGDDRRGRRRERSGRSRARAWRAPRSAAFRGGPGCRESSRSPPPTPKTPARTPETRPIATAIHDLDRLTGGSRRRAPGRRARRGTRPA